MHERKQRMFDEADAFVALPGGVGTLEEVVEQMTWAQLGRHKKPILLANIKGFWDPLCALLEHMAGAGIHPPRRSTSTIWWPTRVEDILPMLTQGARSASPRPSKTMKLPVGAAVSRQDARYVSLRNVTASMLVAVRIADEGGVIAGDVFRTQAGRAVGRAAARDRCGMKRLAPPPHPARAGRCAVPLSGSAGVMARRSLSQNSGYFLPKPMVAGRIASLA